MSTTISDDLLMVKTGDLVTDAQGKGLWIFIKDSDGSMKSYCFIDASGTIDDVPFVNRSRTDSEYKRNYIGNIVNMFLESKKNDTTSR